MSSKYPVSNCLGFKMRQIDAVLKHRALPLLEYEKFEHLIEKNESDPVKIEKINPPFLPGHK